MRAHPLDAVFHKGIASSIFHLRGVETLVFNPRACLEVTMVLRIWRMVGSHKAENLVGHVVELALRLNRHHSQIPSVAVSENKP
jgi:hypothetical protein